jgi:hypothetical protein
MLRLLRLWFSLGSVVTRRDYLISGVGLMLLKYLVEAVALWSVGGPWLNPLRFLDPVLLHRAQWFEHAPSWMPFAVVVWTLPFIWVGLSLSIRRALDAGVGGWLGLLFLVPFLNYLVMAVLASVPSRPPPAVIAARHHQALMPQRRLATALLAFLAAQVVAMLMFGMCVYGLRLYGSSLFVATPVLMGVVHALVLTRFQPAFLGGIIALGQLTLIGSLLILLLFALEGVICLAMAWPFAAVLMAFGSGVGYLLGGFFRPSAAASRWIPLLLTALLPLMAWQESRQVEVPLREVATTVEVDAPPAVVWRRVVGFPDLPPPDGIFATGIACPLRARIEGTGVGAVRYCEFTTGAFVEPITVWDEPRRLGFDVAAQPPPMRELSLFDIQPPHLDGYLRSRRGEFRLIAIDDGGRTRLEGSTWYELEVHPAFYWRHWSDGLIGAIHRRVLDHIRTLAEADVR